MESHRCNARHSDGPWTQVLARAEHAARRLLAGMRHANPPPLRARPLAAPGTLHASPWSSAARQLNVYTDPHSWFQEAEMSTLAIKDLPALEELDRKNMAGVAGGMGRTPIQILAWEVTGKPATWDGMVLEDDGRLHPAPL
jgi:hypothetical protein